MKKYLTVIATDKPLEKYLQAYSFTFFGSSGENYVYSIPDDELDIIHVSELPDILNEPIFIFRKKLKKYIKSNNNNVTKEQ